jgi:hypothetical protein
MYTAKNGNAFYGIKILGAPTDRCEKCMTGVLFSTIFLLLLVGPLLLFSEYGGLTQSNPITSAQFDVGFQLNKTIPFNKISGEYYTKLDRNLSIKV